MPCKGTLRVDDDKVTISWSEVQSFSRVSDIEMSRKIRLKPGQALLIPFKSSTTRRRSSTRDFPNIGNVTEDTSGLSKKMNPGDIAFGILVPTILEELSAASPENAKKQIPNSE